MGRDIDAALKGWEFRPDVIQARLIKAADGREIVQMRVDLGVLQLETTGRPDGTQPHGFPTYRHYVAHLAEEANQSGETLTLNAEQCQEADREFLQFYHRRVCWLALRQYGKAVTDADHTLDFMDLVRDHSPNEEFTLAHEQYRGLVLFHRTQAEAARSADTNDPNAAIDAIRNGLDQLREHFAHFGLEDRMEDDGMVRQLRKLERQLRDAHGVAATLQERLAEAVANENYEEAARLRDLIRQQAT